MSEDLLKVKNILKARGCSDRTINNYISSLNRFKNYFKNNKWVNCKNGYLFKVEVLSSLFKNKFLALLKKEDLKFPKHLSHLKGSKQFNNFLRPLYNKDWVTYIEPPKGSPENVVEYIGRYSFRVAISNSRIKSINSGLITFEYKDYKDKGKIKLMTLTADEFIRRFLLHILPDRFTKIKHYELLANRNKKSLLKLCRILIGQKVFNDFTISLSYKRKSHEYVCENCGHTKFMYSFYYRSIQLA